MSNFKIKFGKRLTELRKKRGISQEKMAENIGIAPRNLSKIETGVTFPSIETLEKIIFLLDCKTSDLFSFEHLEDDIKSKILKQINELSKEKLQYVYKFLKAIE